MSAYLFQHLLRDSAQRSPDAVAIVAAGVTLSYAQLEKRSDEIASLLQSLGVKRGDFVGICLPKSVDTIAAWFAALKCGAAYVPLDAAWPAQRVLGVLAQGKMPVLITSRKRKDLGAAPGVQVVWDQAAAEGGVSLAEASGAPRPVGGVDLDVAYVYFTSGSTGRPKGAMISHRASLSYLETSDRILQIRPDDVVAGNASLSFDLSSFEIGIAIRGGARASYVSEEAMLMPGALVKYLDEQRPTVLYMVPSAMGRLVALSAKSRLLVPSLRALLFAGEAPNLAVLRKLQETFPNATYHHWYGSTEAALVTAAQFEAGGTLPDPIPIGRAVDNVDLALISETDDVFPVGAQVATGELLVSANLLFEGYCYEDEMLQQSFLTRRIEGGRSQRWFRTRDIVRTDATGQLFYVNRNDRMVKVKGQRVDLGEIEGVLQRLAGVTECAVVTLPDPETGARIFAFAVAENTTSKDLRASLKAELAPRMVPDSIQVVDSLPKTTSGKIDRRALGTLARSQEPAGSDRT